MNSGMLGHVRKSSNGRYSSITGTFTPQQGTRYIGHGNPHFKSKLELRLMLLLDNPRAVNVLSWSYETLKIPYLDSSSTMVENGILKHPTRHYIIDFVVKLRTSAGVQSFWIETKSLNDVKLNTQKRMNETSKA